MNITVFGGTGRTGLLLVTQALNAGHELTVLARTPSKLPMDHERLTIVQGGVQGAAKVEEAVKDAEAVLSVLGPVSNAPVFMISQGMENILAAMKRHGVRRLVQSVGAGVVDPKDKPGLPGWLIGVLLRTFSRYVHEDMQRVADLVRASDLDWTIVRVPRLVNGERTGNLKVGYVGRGVGSQIVRGDVAAFILQQAEDLTYLHQAPAISN